MPTSNLGNSFLPLLILVIFDQVLSKSLNFYLRFQFRSMSFASITGNPVLYFLPLRISPGLLFNLGISVALNMSIASHASSVFLTKICLIVCTIRSTETNRVMVVCAAFFPL